MKSIVEQELDKIPSFSEFELNLKELFESDKSKLTQDELGKLYYEKAVVLPGVSRIQEQSILNRLHIFRARVLHPEEDDTLINTFSYPHPTLCNKNGRANIANNPVFYGSARSLGAILETKPETGDEIYLSVWKVNCDREVQFTSFVSQDVKEDSLWFEHAQLINNFFTAESKKNRPSKEKQLKFLFESIQEIFVTEKENYPLSSWISNQILYCNNEIDFIRYPSVYPHNYNCNMAFRPNFIDKYFVFDRVYKIKIKDYDKNNHSPIGIHIKKVGEVKKVHIEWREACEEDSTFLVE